MLGFHGLSVQPISSLETASAAVAPPNGWASNWNLRPVARTIAAGVIITTSWCPQPITAPAAQPTVGWTTNFPARTFNPVIPAPLNQAAFTPLAETLPAGTPAPWAFGVSFPAQTFNPVVRPRTNSLAYTLQEKFSLTGTPSEWGYNDKFPARTANPVLPAPLNNLASTPFLGLAGTATPSDWAFGTTFPAQTINPVVARKTSALASTLQEKFSLTATPTEWNFWGGFPASTINPVRAAPLNSTAFTPIPFAAPTPTPTQLGFAAQWPYRNLSASLLKPNPPLAWNPQVIAGFATQFAGLRYFKGTVKELCLVAWTDRNAGNAIAVMKGGTQYAAYLVDTTDPNASPVRVQTSTGIKAIRFKT